MNILQHSNFFFTLIFFFFSIKIFGQTWEVSVTHSERAALGGARCKYRWGRTPACIHTHTGWLLGCVIYAHTASSLIGFIYTSIPAYLWMYASSLPLHTFPSQPNDMLSSWSSASASSHTLSLIQHLHFRVTHIHCTKFLLQLYNNLTIILKVYFRGVW